MDLLSADSAEERVCPAEWLRSEFPAKKEAVATLFRQSSFVIYPNLTIWNSIRNWLRVPIDAEAGRIVAEAAAGAGAGSSGAAADPTAAAEAETEDGECGGGGSGKISSQMANEIEMLRREMKDQTTDLRDMMEKRMKEMKEWMGELVDGGKESDRLGGRNDRVEDRTDDVVERHDGEQTGRENARGIYADELRNIKFQLDFLTQSVDRLLTKT